MIDEIEALTKALNILKKFNKNLNRLKGQVSDKKDDQTK